MKRRLADIIVRVVLLFVVVSSLAACTTASGSFCAISPQLKYHQPVYDAMTDAEAAKHLAYLKTGEKLCGWKA